MCLEGLNNHLNKTPESWVNERKNITKLTLKVHLLAKYKDIYIPQLQMKLSVVCFIVGMCNKCSFQIDDFDFCLRRKCLPALSTHCINE